MKLTARQIFEKHIGTNQELGYIPIKNEDVMNAINEALSKHDVIKNEVAVCPECGCNKVQKLAGDNYSCMNAYCEWQTVL